LREVVPALIDDYVLARPLIYKIAVEMRVPKHSKFHVFASPARFSRKIRSKGRCEWACRMLRIDGVGCNARTMMCKNDNTTMRCLMCQDCHLIVESRSVILVYLTVLRDVSAVFNVVEIVELKIDVFLMLRVDL